MKTPRLFIYASCLISILAGFRAGTFFLNKENSPASNNAAAAAIDASPNGQENIWLIIVDRLTDSDPKIVGMWLWAYLPNYTTITPLPLFPSPNTQQNTELQKAFHLSKDRKIAQDFLSYLRTHNHPIADYVIIDVVAAASLINLYDGVNIRGNQLSGIEALAQVQKKYGDPQESLQYQIAIMDSLCRSIFTSDTIPDFDKYQNQVRNHMVSNLDLEKKMLEWQKKVASGNQKTCNFSDLYDKSQLTSIP